jgi:hypothetical protein
VLCVVLSCVGSGLATGSSPVQGVLPNVQNIFISFRSQILNRNNPKDLIRIHYLLKNKVKLSLCLANAMTTYWGVEV